MTLSSMPSSQRGGVLITFLRQVIRGAFVLFVIAFLTLFGLNMAALGRAHKPFHFFPALWDTAVQLWNYFFKHPPTYLWQKAQVPAFDVVEDLFINSAGLLLAALTIAALLGILFGTIAALRYRKGGSSLLVVASTLGISTPSFLLAMLFWVINIWLYHALGLKKALLPSAGFGWDARIILPALVLAARPMAQVMQVTYTTLTDILQQEYIRAARARGIPGKLVILRHAFRNALIPILTTLGTSLRFSLASLPIIEGFFNWRGLGWNLLKAIQSNQAVFVTDLILALGLFFLVINLVLELLYRRIDPRLRRGSRQVEDWEEAGLSSEWGSFLEEIKIVWQDLKAGIKNLLALLAGKPKQISRRRASTQPVFLRREQRDPTSKPSVWRAARTSLRNIPLLAGFLLVLGLIILVVFGKHMAAANPYVTNGIMIIEDVVQGPPFKPSSVFPWGSDLVGRDMQALVLWGARQTLVMAIFGMLARVFLGTVLGMIAGWWQNSWMDRTIQGLISVWAAFPVTLFAMILILGIGIQHGMGVFILTICLVGWGEIAQTVRAEVISQKPSQHIEAARALGAGSSTILFRHMLPHLWKSLLVSSMLEMAAVLMLLAELGYLNIFLGGGFKVEISAETYYAYSDVPEWGALLANVQGWWRSYPWLAWAPGVFFFVSILAFNLLGEGLRRFLDEGRINLGRLINRYTILIGTLLVAGLFFLVRTNAPVDLYRAEALNYEEKQTQAIIEKLASPEFMGRETGTEGARLAAEYIAEQMEEIGLQTGGSLKSYIQELAAPRAHLASVPVVEMLDSNGNIQQSFVYRKDFVECATDIVGQPTGDFSAHIRGLVLGEEAPVKLTKQLFFYGDEIEKSVFIVREKDFPLIKFVQTGGQTGGLLIVKEDDEFLNTRDIFTYTRYTTPYTFPTLYITESMADILLATAGSSLEQMEAISSSIPYDQFGFTEAGATVHLREEFLEEDLSEVYYNVIGYIPGTGSLQGEEQGKGLDNRVILVTAYYDGLGTGPDGTLYPGANDNASGVAMMLELARLMKDSNYQPDKTIVFVAWAGGERREGLSLTNVMNAESRLSLLEPEAVIELSGVGAGSGNALALGQGTSYRLVRLFEQAASRLNVRLTNTGRDPHADRPGVAGFGGRQALSAYVSWDGSDMLVHTPEDTPAIIDPVKLRKVGRTVYLVLLVLSRETEY